MGNCSLKGAAAAEGPNSIPIMTDSGGITEFEGGPSYGIFGPGHVSSPLLGHEQLRCEKFYYLLPLGEGTLARHKESVNEAVEAVRMSTSAAALDVVNNLKNGSAVEVLPPPQKGVWRVKLVIDTKQLEEILSEEALIEQMRLAASSASVMPKRTRISWGQWRVNWRPILTNVFKELPDFRTGSSSQGKVVDELISAT